MKKILGAILIIPIGFLIAYGFNFYYFRLSERSSIDQILSLIFLTVPLVFTFYSIWFGGWQKNMKLNTASPLTRKSVTENIPGLILAAAFFVTYLSLGRTLNDFGVGQVDNLFDADVASWTRRIASPDVKDFEMRSPHPFTYFIFRPFGLTLNLITDHHPLSAAVFTAMTGGACVFLVWLFVKREFQSRIYAFLMAALLGMSTSHLFFGSVIETYIFSAFALLLFFLLVRSNNVPLLPLIAASVLTFGITLTNFIQNLIGFIIARPKVKDIFWFVGWTLSISLMLTFLHAAVYPASKLFFLVPDVQNEGKFFSEMAEAPEWRITGRLVYLTRTMMLYTVAAPNVFILTEEVGSTIPEFRFYKISIGTFHQASYDGLGQILIIVWAIFLAVSGLVFLWRLLRERKIELTLAMLLCLLFNFVIHVNYGQELFLYSPDWAYALILFVAFGLSPFAKNRFFQAGLFVFIILLAYNQWQFMSTVLNSLEAYAATLPPMAP